MLGLSLAFVAAGVMLAAAIPAASGPDALPALVAGVIGSGDQLSLQFRPAGDAPARTVRLGETVLDGWTLSGLTDTAATLSKDGQSRTIGLNPTGALAQAQTTGRATTVKLSLSQLTPEMAAIMTMSEEELVAQMAPALRPSYEAPNPVPYWSVEEQRRIMLYGARMRLLTPLLVEAARANMRADGSREPFSVIISTRTQSMLFGTDYVDLMLKERQYSYEGYMQTYQSALAAGVGMIWIPAGQNATPYPGALMATGRSDLGSAYILQAPRPPTPIDQPYPIYPPPVLTADMVAAMTGPDGAPASAAAQAAALAGNQKLLADMATARAREAITTYYGPFGIEPSPNQR